MRNIFKELSEEKIAKIRKFFLLGVSIISFFLMLLTALTPYLSYKYGANKLETFTPIRIFDLLQNNEAWEYGTAYIGIGIFAITLTMASIALVFLGKGVLSFFYNEKKLAKNAGIIVRLSLILTCICYLSGILLAAVFRASDVMQEIYAIHSPALFVLSLITYLIYNVAIAFLNKTENVKAEENEVLGTQKQQWIRKGIFLGLTALSVIIMLCLYGVAFCWYKQPNTQKYIELFPKHIIPFVRKGDHLTNNMAYSALVSFTAITIGVIISLKLFTASLTKIFSDEKQLVLSSKRSLIFSTVFTGTYFVGSLIASAVFYLTGAMVLSAINFIPLLIMALALIGFSVMMGIYHRLYLAQQEEQVTDEKTKVKNKKKRKVLYKARWELFVCVILVVGLSIAALLTNILTVRFTLLDIPGLDKIALPEIKLVGYDLIKNYLILDSGAQTLSFIIMALLISILIVFFFTLISFISRSSTFYKISLGAIALCTISTFLVGMFGKYYNVVEALNKGILKGYISSYFSNQEWLELAFEVGLEYKVTSHSLYYSFGVFAIIAYLLFRNPYTKGIETEKEFARQQEEELPQTIQGEISLKDVPEELMQLNDGRTVVQDKVTKEEKVIFADPCPIFTELDEKIPQFEAELAQKQAELFEAPTLPKLVQFIVEYARDSRLHLSYTEEDIATFVAGLGTTKLTILQGMSGTGKTSLPKIFSEALHARCEIIEVESSWRDKNELLGYYNEFSKNFTPKKFTQALYRAKLNPETLTFIVLDEMNLSRIEYYFSDFLSLMENEPDKRELRLLNVSLARTEEGEKKPYVGLFEGHTIKIPTNVWFIGTANRDESTFEISDKVYDRAHTMNFNKRAPKVLYYNDPVPKRFLPISTLEKLFEEAKATVKFNIDNYPVITEVEKLLAPYNISFGNRIAMQIESFVNVYCSCFAASEEVIHTAVERILLSKVVSKLELKSVENKELLASEFEKLNLHSCSAFILKLNED